MSEQEFEFHQNNCSFTNLPHVTLWPKVASHGGRFRLNDEHDTAADSKQARQKYTPAVKVS